MPIPPQENLHCLESRGPAVWPRKAAGEREPALLDLLIFFKGNPTVVYYEKYSRCYVLVPNFKPNLNTMQAKSNLSEDYFRPLGARLQLLDCFPNVYSTTFLNERTELNNTS